MGLTPVIQFWMHLGRHSLPVGLDVESETNGGRHRHLEDFRRPSLRRKDSERDNFGRENSRGGFWTCSR